MVHTFLHVLAAGAACVGPLSLYLADSLAVPYRGDSRGRRPVAREIHFFPPRSVVARTSNNLTNFRLLASQ